ncbi:MAG: ThiF family adenylyltransferase [Magnetococcales bacterium]|nr:ThiF family adenylyltransferase [Magnetococcales bacterium]MBF0116745.1 ThiF family adenylyltransferase [Magnetococcales bacterium]
MHELLRLRPSVAMVPGNRDADRCQVDFFLGNTRRSLRFVLKDDIFSLLKNMDGKRSIGDLARNIGRSDTEAIKLETQAKILCERLVDACVLEPVSIAEKIAHHHHRRVLSFLQDYFPGPLVFTAWERLRKAKVMVLGVGGAGSWVVNLLARSGIGTLLISDPDRVELSNLNRSLFSSADVGKLKVDALANHLRTIDSELIVHSTEKAVYSAEDFESLISGSVMDCIPDLVINCADYPSIDETSSIINKACITRGIPFIIGGGYNLHVSLIGPTIIPRETACFTCIQVGLQELQKAEFGNLRKLTRKDRKIGSCGPMVGIAATYTVHEGIRTILRGERIHPLMTNRRAELNFLTGGTHQVSFHRRTDCPHCF